MLQNLLNLQFDVVHNGKVICHILVLGRLVFIASAHARHFFVVPSQTRQFPVFALGDLELGLLDQLSEGVDHHVEEVDEEHEAEQGHGAGARVPHYHRVELVRLHEEEHRVEESDQSELV